MKNEVPQSRKAQKPPPKRPQERASRHTKPQGRATARPEQSDAGNEGGIADMPRHVPTLASVIHPQKHLAQHEKIRLIREIRCSIPHS